jgi:hypothetical protein
VEINSTVLISTWEQSSIRDKNAHIPAANGSKSELLGPTPGKGTQAFRTLLLEEKTHSRAASLVSSYYPYFQVASTQGTQ